MNAILIYAVLSLPAAPAYHGSKQVSVHLSQAACVAKAAKYERKTKIVHKCETMVVPQSFVAYAMSGV